MTAIINLKEPIQDNVIELTVSCLLSIGLLRIYGYIGVVIGIWNVPIIHECLWRSRAITLMNQIVALSD